MEEKKNTVTFLKALLIAAILLSTVLFLGCSKREATVGGAVLGAAGGAGIGAAVGDTEGAVAGGIIGAVTGGLIGHSVGKKKKRKK